MSEEKSGLLAQVIEQFLDKKTDSISVSKTSTGKWSFDVKVYTDDLLDETKRENVINVLKAVHARLEKEFQGAPSE